MTWEPHVAEQILARQENQGLRWPPGLPPPARVDAAGAASTAAAAAAEEERRRRRGSPYMVALVGMPGSGKSTGAAILTDCLNGADSAATTLCLPSDGYHYPLETLKAMMMRETKTKANRDDDLIYRRGAPDTFDVKALERDLKRIRYNLDGEDQISLPGFDHAVGDPQPNQHTFVRQQHQIVIAEGLYLLHDGDGWEGIRDCFDFTVYIDTDLTTCLDRLKWRNQSIPGYTVREIIARVDAVDRVNALTVQASRHRAHLVVPSTTTAGAATVG